MYLMNLKFGEGYMLGKLRPCEIRQPMGVGKNLATISML